MGDGRVVGVALSNLGVCVGGDDLVEGLVDN